MRCERLTPTSGIHDVVRRRIDGNKDLFVSDFFLDAGQINQGPFEGNPTRLLVGHRLDLVVIRKFECVLLGNISTEDASTVSIVGDDNFAAVDALFVIVFDGSEVGRHAEVVGERHAANRLGAVRHAVVVEAHLEQALAALLIGADSQWKPTGGGHGFPGLWFLGGISIGASDPLGGRRRRCLEAKEDEWQERELHGKLFPRCFCCFVFCELWLIRFLDEASCTPTRHD